MIALTKKLFKNERRIDDDEDGCLKVKEKKNLLNITITKYAKANKIGIIFATIRNIHIWGDIIISDPK